MPEPVFRRSEGYTPEAKFTGNEDETITPDAIAVDKDTNERMASAPTPIAEQPEIHDDTDVDTVTTQPQPAAKNKTGWFRIFLIIVGIMLVGLAAATVIFGIALGYFFQVSESQNLN
jgi:hypothetical protein